MPQNDAAGRIWRKKRRRCRVRLRMICDYIEHHRHGRLKLVIVPRQKIRRFVFHGGVRVNPLILDDPFAFVIVGSGENVWIKVTETHDKLDHFRPYQRAETALEDRALLPQK